MAQECTGKRHQGQEARLDLPPVILYQATLAHEPDVAA